MKTLLCICFLFVSITYANSQSNQLLFYNVNLVNITDGSVRNGALLIEGKAIKATGTYAQLSKGISKNNQIDGKGKYLMPGLWDMHIHLEGAELIKDNQALLPVFLAYGITTVRDCASDLGEQVLAWREEIAAGKLVGPTIFTAGLKLEGKNSIWKGDLEIENEEELKQALDRLDGYKVDFVKITENTLPGDLFLASVKAARARGYRVSGHVPIDLTIRDLTDAGFTSIEHASYLLRLGSDETVVKADLLAGKLTKAEAAARYSSGFNQQLAIEHYKVLAKSGVFVCPTLIGARQLAYLNEVDHTQDPSLQYLTERFVSNYQWRIQRMSNETPEQRQARKESYQLLKRQLPLFQQAGIKLIAGSDAAALNTLVYPAESLIEELEIWEEAGLTPLQILQAAILNGAAYFGILNKTSGLEAGKNADLVLLDENPLKSIKAVRTVNAVVAQGKYYDRAALDALMKTARDTKVLLDNSRK